MAKLTLERQEQYRARYAAMQQGWQPATRLYEQWIRGRLREGALLVDLGCGRGGVVEQLADVPLRAFGLDPDHASLCEHRLPLLPRAVAGAECLPLPAASVDLLVSAWVLEHLPDPAPVFAEVGRVLRVGGAFIFLTPNLHSPVTQMNRLLKPLQSVLVPRLYGRAEADTFPVVYRANTVRRLQTLAAAGSMTLEACRIIADPSYLAFNEVLFSASVMLTRLLPVDAGVHLVGVCVKQ
jgi:SAM-dependent methyltransferase